jgi:hypothetical protein
VLVSLNSVGWELGGREKAAIAAVPARAWQIAVNARGEVREPRADEACDLDCCHRQYWIEEAHVTELTSLLCEGPAGDQLKGWPATMRIFARRERPHPGAQLTLFEAVTAGGTPCGSRTGPPSPKAGSGRMPTSTPSTGCTPGSKTHRQGLRHRQVFRVAGDEQSVAGRCPGRCGPAGRAPPTALDGGLAKAEPKTL